MACPWWDDDDKRMGGSSPEEQKGKSHEKDKGLSHEHHNKGKSHEYHNKGKNHYKEKMKGQKHPGKNYKDGYNNGYERGYEEGYEDGYEQGCENTRDTKFGEGQSGTQDSGKKSKYGNYTSGYTVKSRETVRYHHGYELGNDSSSDDEEYGYNDYGAWNDSDDSDY